jgi:hypothetical protein
MKKKILTGIIVVFLVVMYLPRGTAEEHDTFANEKPLVYIKGESHQYKFGSFLHIGKIWWCPNYDMKIVFDVDESFTFSVNGEEQSVSGDRVSISMKGFFGIAPTLYSYLNNEMVLVYGICDEVRID